VGLRSLALYLQREDALELPIHILNMIPWLLMLLTLIFVASGLADTIIRYLPESWRIPARQLLRSDPPGSLGTAFEKE
jgi:hypothetical protein